MYNMGRLNLLLLILKRVEEAKIQGTQAAARRWIRQWKGLSLCDFLKGP
jgi:hypothetical protein